MPHDERWIRGGCLVLDLACATLAHAGAVRDDEPAAPTAQAAEQIGGEFVDPGYVESMSAAIARDRADKRAGRPKAAAPFDRHGEWGALILELRAASGPDRNGG